MEAISILMGLIGMFIFFISTIITIIKAIKSKQYDWASGMFILPFLSIGYCFINRTKLSKLFYILSFSFIIMIIGAIINLNL